MSNIENINLTTAQTAELWAQYMGDTWQAVKPVKTDSPLFKKNIEKLYNLWSNILIVEKVGQGFPLSYDILKIGSGEGFEGNGSK